LLALGGEAAGLVGTQKPSYRRMRAIHEGRHEETNQAQRPSRLYSLRAFVITTAD
jgi:hypothetical protein